MITEAKIPRIIVTGAPGTGKTTLIVELAKRGWQTVPEPARRVIAEERHSGGRATSDQDAELFLARMLEICQTDLDKLNRLSAPCFLDRAVPDLLAYACVLERSDKFVRAALDRAVYSRTVLYCAPWRRIFANDAERTLSFEATEIFDDILRSGYQELGYELVELDKTTISARADIAEAVMSSLLSG